MNPKMYRVNLTLPRELAEDIAQVAAELRVSQSALVAVILESPLGRLARYMALAPRVTRDPAEPGVLRMRGESEAVVRDLIEQAIVESMTENLLL
jgi:hypothetical protein